MKYNWDDISDYVAGLSIEDVKIKYGLKNVIKLASNENPYGAPASVLHQLKKDLKNIYLYPDNEYKKLKSLLSEKNNIPIDHLILGNGSDEVFELLFKAIIEPKDKIITFSPSYSLYTILMESHKAKPIYIQLKNFQYDLKTIKKYLSNKIKMIILCNPNNPTGTYLKQSDLDELIKSLPSHTFLLLDEAYSDYVASDDFPDSIQLLKQYKNKNIAILRTFSKIFGLAGLRLGYGLTHPSINKILNKLRPPFNINSLAERAACYSLETDKYTQAVYELNQFNKIYFYEQLEELKLTYLPTEANFIFIKLPMESKIVFEELLKKGIIIRTINHADYKYYIRVTIGTKGEIKQFIQQLKMILKKY